VAPGSAAAIAGVEKGDHVVAVNGKAVQHAIEALSLLSSKPERVTLGLDRNGQHIDAPLVLSWTDSGTSNLGLSFETQTRTIRSASVGAAFGDGLAQTWKTFSISIKGLGLLFRGVNLFKAVSGPARITYLVGRSATESFQHNGSGGMALPFNFLAFLSIGLFIMNLLPIPALDGGLILLFVIEWLRRRPLRALTVYRFQYIGVAFIMALFLFATVGDVLFFTAK
jgi:regulator of sigma E protease